MSNGGKNAPPPSLVTPMVLIVHKLNGRGVLNERDREKKKPPWKNSLLLFFISLQTINTLKENYIMPTKRQTWDRHFHPNWTDFKNIFYTATVSHSCGGQSFWFSTSYLLTWGPSSWLAAQYPIFFLQKQKILKWFGA